MPPKVKSVKNNVGGHYRPKKRKAISPLEAIRHITCTKTSRTTSRVDKHTDKHSDSDQSAVSSKSTASNYEVKPQNSQYYPNPPYYTSYTANMNNMSYQSPFGSQFMQSPPFTPQTQMTPGVSPFATPPPWAIEMIEDIKSLKISMTKIDKIERTVDKINSKVDNLETNVKNIEARVASVEQSASFMNDQYESTKQKLQSTDSDIKKIDKQCKEMESAINELKSQNDELENKQNELEARSMRENLLFFGFTESDQEDCSEKIKQFIREKLQIEEPMVFDRAHRIRKMSRTKIRPIVVKFHYYSQREQVRKTAHDKIETLKSASLGVGVQQTRAVINQRRRMNDIYRREKASGKQLRWSGGKLLVRDRDGEDFREITA